MSRLKPCPESPNCVCSHTPSSRRQHAIAPLTITGDVDTAMARLARVVSSLPRSRVHKQEEGYLWVVCTTALLRFRDDVEFELDRDAAVIHVRSASRLGYSDLGVNRRRVETIRERFEQA